MGLDGFTVSNLGINRDTSAQVASQTEHGIQRAAEQSQGIGELQKKYMVDRKKQKDEQDKHEFQDGLFEDEENEEEDGEEEASDENSQAENSSLSKNPDLIQSLEDGSKSFSIKINEDSQKVELFEENSKKLITQISPEDLIGLVSKLDNASGILINRRI